MHTYLGKVVVSLGLVTALLLWGPTHTQGRWQWGSHPATVWACGLGQPQTMDADNQPAVTFPVTPTTPSGSPTGVFEQYFGISQVVHFNEDLSRLPTPIDLKSFQWAWNFGDGHTASGFSATHTYVKSGTYAVRLQLIDPKDPTVSDPNFDSSSITITAQQYASPPIAQITSSATYVQLGSALSYDATGSHAQAGGDVTYTWNFNDTSPEEHSVRVTHQFVTEGQAFVELIVQDAQGARTVTTVPVVVVLALPTAQLSASSIHANIDQSVTFDASKSAPTSLTGDAIIKYQWDFGDNTTESSISPTITHGYAKAGTYVVQVQAINKQGYPGSASITVQIADPGLFGLGSHATLILGGGGMIALLLLLGIVGNAIKERREEQRRLAREAARRARQGERRPYRQ